MCVTYSDCMNVSKSSRIAVLTGDIIGSTQMETGDLERAIEALRNAAHDQAPWHGQPLHFSRQRGDGWQVRLARPERALRSALALRAALRCEGKEYATFMAAAEGPAVPIAPDENLNHLTDETFVQSGRLLDLLKRHNTQQQLAHLAINATGAAFVLADHISQSWTPAQAAAILPMLAPGKLKTHTEVAQGLGKSRQAVTKALDGAGFDAIITALSNIEDEAAAND